MSAKSEEKLNKSDVPKSGSNKPDVPEFSAKSEENGNKSDVPNSDSENKGKGGVPEIANQKGQEKQTQHETENKDVNLSGNKSENKPKYDVPELSTKSEENGSNVPNSDSAKKGKGEEKPTQSETENKDINLSGNKDSETKNSPIRG